MWWIALCSSRPSTGRDQTGLHHLLLKTLITLDPLLPNAVSQSAEVNGAEQEESFETMPVAPHALHSAGLSADAGDAVALAMSMDSSIGHAAAYMHAVQTAHVCGASPVSAALWGDRYFERQEENKCGRHALNNIIGGPQFLDSDLIAACMDVVAAVGGDPNDHARTDG